MDAHMATRYGEGPKNEASVEAVPPCWTICSVGLHKSSTASDHHARLPLPGAAGWQVTAAAAPQRHTAGPGVSLNHGVKLVRTVQYPAFPSHPLAQIWGNSQRRDLAQCKER